MRYETFSDTCAMFPIGTRVRFEQSDDRFPNFIVPNGTIGIVVHSDAQGLLIHVEQFVEGLSDSLEWEGDYQWFPDHAVDYERPFVKIEP